ncbi:MAG TPA: D-alanyl-D-alanine carboxypeptidase [Xanthobacteraceae bacterium]|nr:D-alanyl-D-alanine carboxypeptidase [Xanthobacteraceae bacterium]
MLRIRTGARDGLRWGLFGFVAAVLTLSNHPTHAAPYADIVVDANSGAVLHATNPDARRHPASLTKIMTLYLLFEQLDAGKLKFDTPLKVSAEAAGQTPTKLGLKPGSTLAVEDAIKGMVTRSANDAAVVVAEAIAGSEGDFAKLMTHKAQALGMKNTVYKNASGLPDDNQVTTARDQSTLGRAIQERFPRYYKYFSIRSFTFRGESISNHNHLLGKVEGVDGIKTGYINASGFNLVTSVHRGNRYLVAVVMGGSSGGSRDARMRELISEKIAQASTKRTAPMVAEASGTSDFKPEPMVVTKAEAKPEPMAVAKAEPKAEPKPEPMVVTKPEPKVAAAKVEPKEEPKAQAKTEPRFAVASATSLPVRLNPSAAPAEPAAMRSEPAATATPTQARVVAGSTEPIRPVLVKTLTVRAGVRTASLAPLHVASPAAEPQPAAAAAPAPTPVAAAKPEPAAPPPAPVTAAKPEPSAPPPAPVAAAKPEPAAPPPAPVAAAKPEPSAPPPAPVAAAKPEPAAPAAEVATKPEPAAAPSTPAIAAKGEPAAPPPMSVAAAKPEPAAEPPGPAVPNASPAPVAAAAPAPAAPAAKAAPMPTARPASAAPTAKPQHKPGWMIQVGAYPAEQAAKQRLSAVQTKASKMLTGAEAFTETIDKGGTTYYRARFAGLDKDKAEAACKYLKKNDVECVTIKN